jgi:hypothetical protein
MTDIATWCAECRIEVARICHHLAELAEVDVDIDMWEVIAASDIPCYDGAPVERVMS